MLAPEAVETVTRISSASTGHREDATGDIQRCRGRQGFDYHLQLRPEPRNTDNPNAIQIPDGGVQLGYVHDPLVGYAADVLSGGRYVLSVVTGELRRHQSTSAAAAPRLGHRCRCVQQARVADRLLTPNLVRVSPTRLYATAIRKEVAEQATSARFAGGVYVFLVCGILWFGRLGADREVGRYDLGLECSGLVRRRAG